VGRWAQAVPSQGFVSAEHGLLHSGPSVWGNRGNRIGWVTGPFHASCLELVISLAWSQALMTTI